MITITILGVHPQRHKHRLQLISLLEVLHKTDFSLRGKLNFQKEKILSCHLKKLNSLHSYLTESKKFNSLL